MSLPITNTTGDPDRHDHRHLTVPELNLIIPDLSSTIVASLTTGHQTNLDFQLLRFLGMGLMEQNYNDIAQANLQLLNMETQLWIRAQLGSGVQRILHISQFVCVSEDYPLKSPLTATALLNCGLSDLCACEPRLLQPSIFPELVATVSALSLIARAEAKSAQEQDICALHIGMLVHEIAQNRVLYSQEPKRDLLDRLIILSPHDQRLAPQIAFLSKHWDELSARFCDFMAHNLPTLDTRGDLSSWHDPHLGTLTLPAADELEYLHDYDEHETQKAIEDIAKRFDWAAEVVSRERYWDEPFSWSLWATKKPHSCAVLNVRPTEERTCSDLEFPNSPPSEQLASALSGLVNMGVTEWRFLLPRAALNPLLSELDTYHVFRNEEKLIDELNSYLTTRTDIKLSTFVGCSSAVLTPHLNAAQQWLREVKGLTQQNTLVTQGRPHPVSVKLFSEGDRRAYEVDEASKVQGTRPLIVGDFTSFNCEVPEDAHVVDLLKPESQINPPEILSLAEILQVVMEDWRDSGRIEGGRFYGIDMQKWRREILETAYEVGFQSHIVLAESLLKINYTLFYLPRRNDGGEHVEASPYSPSNRA